MIINDKNLLLIKLCRNQSETASVWLFQAIDEFVEWLFLVGNLQRISGIVNLYIIMIRVIRRK